MSGLMSGGWRGSNSLDQSPTLLPSPRLSPTKVSLFETVNRDGVAPTLIDRPASRRSVFSVLSRLRSDRSKFQALGTPSPTPEALTLRR